MAFGTNLSQVLISNTDVHHGTTGAFTDITYAAGAPEIGVWDVEGADWVLATQSLFDTTTAGALSTVDTTAGDPTTAIDSLKTLVNPQWNFETIQFCQSVSGTPGVVATPMIHTSMITSIDYIPHNPAVAREVEATPPAVTAGDDLQVKFVIRTVPTTYSSFEDPASGLTDISGNNRVFPLGAFNTTNHKVITLDCPNQASVAALVTYVVAQVPNNKLLDDLLYITDNTTTFDVTARHAGVMIDVIIENVTSGVFGSSQVTEDYEAGSGEGWQVLQDEKLTRGRYGNFNRMYFADSVTQYANTAYSYDKIIINYKTPNWPTGAGIAPAGQTNQVVLYYCDSDGTAPVSGDSGTNTFDTLFGGLTIGTAAKFRWY